MAAPTYYPEWAINTQNLPATGQTNKVRPKESLRNIGFDLGQLPTCEEYNFLMNNTYLWVKYFKEEIVDKLGDTYLPKTGTSITLTGDTTGTATFNASSDLSITTTTKIPSSSITDASANNVASKVVIRDANGDIAVRTLNSVNINNTGTVTSVNTTTTGTTTVAAVVTSSAQGTAINSLTRRDYVDGNINTINSSISTTNNALTTLSNTAYATFVQGVRLGTRGTFVANSGLADAPAGSVITGGGDFGSDDGVYAYRPLQYNINGTWYTAAVV